MHRNLIFILLVSGFLIGCDSLTRYEEDYYIISVSDTTHKEFVRNAPDNDDNGVVFPSSRVHDKTRYLLQKDSLVIREYPNFIRLGLFESVGLLGTGGGDNAWGTGMFGIFPDMDKLDQDFRGDSDFLFAGGMYRFGIGEWRLRWFRDAKNWTYGFSFYEIIAPDALIENRLVGLMPLYVRKRYYLREEIPYIALVPSVGISYYPSQYLNISGSIEIGSLAGLNVRAYAGIVAGFTSNNEQEGFIGADGDYSESGSQVFPYLGLGISLMDFHNLVPETEREWSEMEHSGWDIGLLQFAVLNTSSDESIWAEDLDEGAEQPFLKGYYMRLLNANVALPILNNQFYVGTSLANFMILGEGDWGIGILPLRLGYWHVLMQDELSLEPFIEASYYPSNMVNLGAKVNLRISDKFNIGVLAGFITGDNDNIFNHELVRQYSLSQDFSIPYIGINFGIMDRIFFPEELRYNK